VSNPGKILRSLLHRLGISVPAHPARVRAFHGISASEPTLSTPHPTLRLGWGRIRRAWDTSPTPLLLTLTATAAFFAFTGTAFATEPCPNEQLRGETHSTELPDCRAYELVSPPFTNGQPPEGAKVDADGSRVAFESLADFGEAGLGESAEGALYVASRGSSGWSSVSAMPPADEFQDESPSESAFSRFVSGEMTEWLSQAVPISASPIDMRIYRRRPGGEPVEVGPTASPEELKLWTPAEGGPPIIIAGATPDLSHIFFQPQKGRTRNEHLFWPGDPTTGRESLYEYVGTANTEPVLVDVSPGPREANDRPSEDPTVISKCGAELGGVTVPESSTTSEDNYNAISSMPETEQGHTVFFTAFGTELGKSIRCTGGGSPPVNELYARIGGAKTVAISEPSKEDCESCDTSLSAQESALFQGANQEGSKVFFLTRQQLFDRARGEGLAGTSNLYEDELGCRQESIGACAAAHEEVKVKNVSLVAPEMAGVMRVSEDGSHVYFVSEAALRGAAANEYGVRPADGADNLYVEDTVTHLVTFIAALSPSDSQEWSSEDDRGDVAATPEGRYLVFGSVNDVTPDASGGGRQLYRYDSGQTAQEESLHVPRLVRVSVGDAASDDGNDGASFKMFAPAYQDGVTPVQSPALVTLGGAVFFESEAGLTPQALNFAPVGEFEHKHQFASNVYEYENGNVYLISDGRDTHTLHRGSTVGLVGVSPSGSDVYFKSADSLVGQAGPEVGLEHIYDARVDGGFPAPVPPASCDPESCQPPVGEPPAFAAPSSATFAGSGNLALPPPAVVKPKVETKAEKLAKALKSCRKDKKKSKRQSCEKQARSKYGPTKKKAKAKKASHNGRTGR